MRLHGPWFRVQKGSGVMVPDIGKIVDDELGGDVWCDAGFRVPGARLQCFGLEGVWSGLKYFTR